MSRILDIDFSDLNLDQSAQLVSNCITKNERQCKHIVTANPEIVMKARKDSELLSAVNDSFMVTADGIGVVIASKITNQKIYERVTGFDLITEVFNSFENKNHPLNVYLLGANKENVNSACLNINNSFKFVNVVGFKDGYFDSGDVKHIIDEINHLDVDLLLVGLGCPKQELFISNNKKTLNVNVAIGCGGSIDVFSGNVKRAPKVFQKTGTEWLYRLIKQPSRIKRQITLPLFLVDVLRNK